MDALQMQFLPLFASLVGSGVVLHRGPGNTRTAPTLIPLRSSQEMLDEIKSPLTSFTATDGSTFVLTQRDDYLYVGTSDGDSEAMIATQVRFGVAPRMWPLGRARRGGGGPSALGGNPSALGRP